MCAILPAYNEAKNLFKVITDVKKYVEVIVINERSKDNTGEIAPSAADYALNHVNERYIKPNIQQYINMLVS